LFLADFRNETVLRVCTGLGHFYGINEMTKLLDIRYYSIVTGHTFVFRFRPEQIGQIVRSVGRMVEAPSIPLDFLEGIVVVAILEDAAIRSRLLLPDHGGSRC
jgi:hypothetical protein